MEQATALLPSLFVMLVKLESFNCPCSASDGWDLSVAMVEGVVNPLICVSIVELIGKLNSANPGQIAQVSGKGRKYFPVKL